MIPTVDRLPGRCRAPAVGASSRRDALTWLATGVLVGLVMLWAFDLELRYTIYLLLAVGVASVMPAVVRWAGSLHHLLFLAFVFSLQLQLEYNVLPWPFIKPAGPFAFHISPLLASGGALLTEHWVRRTWAGADRLVVSRSLVKVGGAMLAAGLLSFVTTPDRRLSMFGLFELFTVVLVAVVACDEAARTGGVTTIRRVLFLNLAVQSVLILVELALGVQFSLSHGVAGDRHGNGRFSGTLAVPSAAATFLVVCLFFVGMQMVTEKRGAARQRLGVLGGLGFLSLLLTQTRTAWIGFILGGAGIGWQLLREKRLGLRPLLSLAAMAAVGGLVAWPFIAGRLAEDHASDAEVRWNLVSVALAMIKAQPLVGIGLNTATSQLYTYAALAGTSGWVFIVHNQFLLVFAETGVVGFLAFVAFFGIGIRAAARSMRAADPVVRDAGTVLLWCLLMLVLALNMDHVSGAMTYKLLGFLIGMACGLDHLSGKERDVLAAAAA